MNEYENGRLKMDINLLTHLCPKYLFDWRLYCDRGQQQFIHKHTTNQRIDDCELNFLIKVNTTTIQNDNNDD